MKAVVDRIVQYANRYKLTNVETGEVLGTFDFDEVTGTVQQVGTEIDAELFDGIAADLAARVVANGGDIKDTVVTFSDTTGTAANVASGDKTSTLWGKVKNWFSRLKALAFKDKVSDSDIDDGTISKSKIDGLTEDLNSKYVKPSGGIPASDLDEGSQNNLGNVNKSIYNLGAYDTFVDNGDGTATITRKTGYTVLDGSDDEKWMFLDTDHVFLWINWSVYVGAVRNIVYDLPGLKANFPTYSWGQLQTLNEGISHYHHLRVKIASIEASSNNLEAFKQYLSQHPIYIQYETETSYTETVIDNQPLATLDKNGEQWLRSEWEKTVNYGHIVHEKYLETATVNNANNLGGVAAGEYALKTDIPESLDGTTFTPNVDSEGNLSWTNNGGLPNPDPVNIKGATPTISATATVDDNTGTPSVQVTKSGTIENPSFAFNFSSLKGEKGEEGLGIFRSSASTTSATTSISISTITVPAGRSLKIGDLIIADATYSYLYRVTAVNDTTVTVTYLQSLRGATGSRGATGTTPNISVSASVSNTTGTPSVTVIEGGTTAAPSFAFAFSGLKGSDANVPAVYEHNIHVYSATKRANAFFKILNNSNAKMSFSDIVSTLIQRGQESNDEMCVANGVVEYESELKNVCYVFALNSTSILIGYCRAVGNFGDVVITRSDLFSGYPKDKVVKII